MDFIDKVLTNSPVAAALLFMVVLFLKAIDRRDRMHTEQEDKRDQFHSEQQQRWFEAWKTWNEETAEHAREDRREMSRILEKNSEVLGSVRDYLMDLKGTERLERQSASRRPVRD